MEKNQILKEIDIKSLYDLLGKNVIFFGRNKSGKTAAMQDILNALELKSAIINIYENHSEIIYKKKEIKSPLQLPSFENMDNKQKKLIILNKVTDVYYLNLTKDLQNSFYTIWMECTGTKKQLLKNIKK